MKVHTLAQHLALASVLLAAPACGVGDDSDAGALTQTAPVTRVSRPEKTGADATVEPRAKPSGAVKLPATPRSVDLPAVTERSSLLQRLPKSSLFVLRLPKVGRLAEAYRRSSLASIMNGPEFAGQKLKIDEAVASVENALRTSLPDYEVLREQVLSIDGESVLALTSVDIAAFTQRGSRSSEMPFNVAWMFDAGKHAAVFDALTERFLTSVEAQAIESGDASAKLRRETIDATSWRARIVTEGIEFDLLRESSQFLLAIGPAPKTPTVEHALVMRDIEDSFLAADLTRGTKDLSTASKGVVVEAFVNLEPVWSAVQLLAPADVKSVLFSSGAFSIRGVSAVAALGKTGLDEEVFLMSPGGKDLLTRCLTNRPLEPKLARFVPDNTTAATLCTFDLDAFFTGLTKILPAQEKRDIENGLLQVKKSGVDLRRDLIENLGPTFALVGEFDPAGAFQNDGSARTPQFALVAQLQDGSRFRAMIDALLSRAGVRSNVQAKDIHGFKAYSTGLITLPTPDGREAMQIDPHWYIGDDVLVFSLSRPALARSLAAAWDTNNRGPVALAKALERETGGFAVGVNSVDGKEAAAATFGRATSLGLEFSTKDGSGTATGYSFVTCAGIVAAVAIPNLIVARNAATERNVTNVLRSIGTAQKDFRARKCLDFDSDGEGEFGTLPELAGTSALRSAAPALNPPLLPDGLTPGADGLLRKHGYLFRVDLSNRLTNSVDFDEVEFFAYAWPEVPGGTPHFAFVVDAAGTIRRTDNEGEAQHYAGIERMPKLDAARRGKTGNPKLSGVPQRSSDGGLWRDL